MSDDKKKPGPFEHEPQNSNNLMKENTDAEPPVSRKDTDSVKNTGDDPGLNQAAMDSNILEPNDSSDQ